MARQRGPNSGSQRKRDRAERMIRDIAQLVLPDQGQDWGRELQEDWFNSPAQTITGRFRTSTNIQEIPRLFYNKSC